MAKKLLAFVMAASALVCGCAQLNNGTEQGVAENSSRIYTLKNVAKLTDSNIVESTVRASVVVDGDIRPMKRVSADGDNFVFEYDYNLPNGRTEAKYYFITEYDMLKKPSGVKTHRKITSPQVYTIKPVTRYVVSLQNDRGSVGREVSVLGRGFDKLDKIYIGGMEAETVYESRSSLSFKVPALNPGSVYPIYLDGEKGKISIGTFRVDAAHIGVSPTVLELRSGDIVNMVFNIGFKAPKGGYPIDVKTDVPSSVIMAEVIIPEGAESVSIPVKGAAEGSGNLYINALGFAEKEIPVKIYK